MFSKLKKTLSGRNRSFIYDLGVKTTQGSIYTTSYSLIGSSYYILPLIGVIRWLMELALHSENCSAGEATISEADTGVRVLRVKILIHYPLRGQKWAKCCTHA